MGSADGEPAPHEYRLLDRETVFEGPVISLYRERIAMPGGGDGVRDIVPHPGAVAVVAGAYGSTEITERHRHRYEVANAYRDRLSEAGMVFSGTSPDGTLVEFAELSPDVHPFFVGTQAHPELKSRPTRPHPLFRAFVKGALDYSRSSRLPVDVEETEKVGI